jgi:hypothetical protein
VKSFPLCETATVIAVARSVEIIKRRSKAGYW